MNQISTDPPLVHSGRMGYVKDLNVTKCCGTLNIKIPVNHRLTQREEDVTCPGTPIPYYVLPDGTDVLEHEAPDSYHVENNTSDYVTLLELSSFLRKFPERPYRVEMNWEDPLVAGHHVQVMYEYVSYRRAHPWTVASALAGEARKNPKCGSFPVFVRQGDHEYRLNRDIMYRVMFQIDAHSKNRARLSKEDGGFRSFAEDFPRFMKEVSRPVKIRTISD